MKTRLKVETAPTAELVPYAHNAKDHPDWQIDHIAASIKQFGFNDPVGVWTNPDGQLEIVEGHGRVLAAKQLGIERLPIVKLDHLDDEGRRAYTHAHNITNEQTKSDWDILVEEFAAMPEIDWAEFVGDWTPDNSDYEEWLEKFEPKKTTDDCYTPENIYDTIAEWVAAEYDLDRSKFVRPFYPGGDYQAEKYPKNCVVVDNPPFSILSEIIRYYNEAGVRFFLFAPTLTLFSGRGQDVCYIPADCEITYENGAIVNTSFITNMEPDYRIRTAPDLTAKVKEADKVNREEQRATVLRYQYPPYVVTAAMISAWSAYGVDFRVKKTDAHRISALEAQKEYDKAIFGGGYLLSEAAKAEAEAAKAMDAAKQLGDGVKVAQDGSVVWQLSDREREIIENLGG